MGFRCRLRALERHKGRAGDLDHDGDDDIVLLYNYGTSVRCHVLLSTRHSFAYQGDSGWWSSTSWTSDNVRGLVTMYFNASGSPKRSVEGPAPTAVSLAPNYPNPFNAQTVIAYDLPTATHVRLTVYNVLGQALATLVDGQQEAGSHEAIWQAGRAPSGMYFYRLVTDSAVETKKMLLLK